MDKKRYLPVGVFILVMILLQLFFLITGTDYFLKEVTQAMYYTLVVVGLCLLMGYAGQISMGHAGFFAIGGYTTAVLTTNNLLDKANFPIVIFLKSLGLVIERQDLYGQDLLVFSPWAAFILAILITVLVSYIIGSAVIRLKGHYLAMATLGFGIIIFTIISAAKIFGQHDPITKVPPFKLFFGLEINGRLPFRVMNYYLACFFLAFAAVLVINLINSRIGRAFKSIHGNEGAANSLGIDTAKHKLSAFMLSAVFAAVAGVFMTHYNAAIGPSEVSITKSIRYVAIVAVGGMSNIWGTVSMGILLNFLSLRGFFGKYDDLIFGIILIAVMVFAPEGLLQPSKLKMFKNMVFRLFKREKNGRAS